MAQAGSTPPLRDPREVKTRDAVMRAVELLVAEEGASAVSYQRVADRSGVSRATLYRHWPSSADLVYDAMAGVQEPFFRESGGPLLPWLRKELRRTAHEMGHPNAVQFVAFLLERAALEPAGAALRDGLLDRTVAPLRGALERAALTGELTGAPDADDLLACLLGPIIFRVVHANGRADGAFIDGVIDLALAPWRGAQG